MNSEVHPAHNMAPNDVTTENENQVWLRQYADQLFTSKQTSDLKPGDRVRISTHKVGAFYKGFEASWSDEIFKLSELHVVNFPMDLASHRCSHTTSQLHRRRNTMKVRIVLLHPEARCPTQQYQAAGLDLYSIENKIIFPYGRVTIKTGIAVELPVGTYGQLKERSSMAKRGLIVNGGVIDNDYRGEILVILKNDSYSKVEIKVGTRIGQLLVNPYPHNLEIEVAELIHPEEFGSEERLAGASSKLSGKYSTITDLFAKCKWTSPSNSGSYSSTHPVQSRFIQDLIDCICIDCLPLDFIQRPSFIKLICNLNSQIRLVSRTTHDEVEKFGHNLKRRFRFTLVQEKLKKVFRSIENRCLHRMLDLWTDRHKQSILGIKVQFITKDWKIQNYTTGFRHFTKRHDAPCIRRVFDSVLHGAYGIKPENVGFIVGDNASNMIAAFKSDYPLEFPLHDVEKMSDDTDQWEDMEEFSDDEDCDDTDIEDKICSLVPFAVGYKRFHTFQHFR
ncbi:unnamed protein product [Allacma fusca]|uniref:dUTP diphosphatase n=1 Tax=Allacma fusca TaxID=39272 RepID=A0A8J2NU16_9HEXA|nr:unnamed protein product [Allacma fusca]